MKFPICHATAVVGLSLLSSWALLAQTSPPAAPSAAGKRAAKDAKEKAEDAALLQQLESEAQSSDADVKPKESRSGRSAGHGTKAGVGPVTVPFTVQNLLTRPGGGAVKPLMVRTSDPDSKAQAALEEDLAVMAHILGKTVDESAGGQANTTKALGIDVFFTPGSSPLRSLYLDNYGAVFFLSVGFPLIAPQEKRVEEKPATDSDWEDARQELYGQRLQAAIPGEPAEDFSQEKVDKLREKLLESLKNATNIRGLKPDEFVTLWVSGGASSSGRRFRTVKANAPGNFGGVVGAEFSPDGQRIVTASDDRTVRIWDTQTGQEVLRREGRASPSSRTIMTIRVTKGDIDSYSKGKLVFDEFQKRARITTYTSEGSGVPGDGVFVGGYTGKSRF
jgi:hypothetical protein